MTLLALAALCAPLAATAAPATAADARTDLQPTSVLVLGLTPQGVDPGLALSLGDVLTAELAALPGLKVLTRAELQAMLGLEAERQALGCDDTGCLAELASALGAQVVVTGRLGQVGSVRVLAVQAIDAGRVQVLQRVDETVAGDDEALILVARSAALRLFPERSPADRLADAQRLSRVTLLHVATEPPDHPLWGPVRLAGWIGGGLAVAAAAGLGAGALSAVRDPSAVGTYQGRTVYDLPQSRVAMAQGLRAGAYAAGSAAAACLLTALVLAIVDPPAPDSSGLAP